MFAVHVVGNSEFGMELFSVAGVQRDFPLGRMKLWVSRLIIMIIITIIKQKQCQLTDKEV